MKNTKSFIQKLTPKGTHPPMGAYSHAVLVPLAGADMLFVTGQIAVDEHDNVVAPNDASKQTESVFESIGKILAEGGFSFRDVVKAQIFLTNIKDFSALSPIRNKYFADSRPVSTLVEVSKLVREGCCVEIEVIAMRLRPN
jgi:reactive intermediate/imine deaminase